MNTETQIARSSDVQDQLCRILKSLDFHASERNRRFLEYVVHETLEGRSDRIKAYNIATSVLGRGGNFDPQQDSIVRIEAGRLRRSLERYYLTSGVNDPLRITIPTGSYVPVFTVMASELNDAAPQTAATVGADILRWRHHPSILVVGFDEDGDLSAYPKFTRGLTRGIVAGLTRFAELHVFGPVASIADGYDSLPVKTSNGEDIDFYLIGGTAISRDGVGADLLLVNARTGRNLWAESIKRQITLTTAIQIRDDIANVVVQKLAQPYGIIFSAMMRDAEGRGFTDSNASVHLARFYEYHWTLDDEQSLAVRLGLEQAIHDVPDFDEAYACLSLLYSDGYRFNRPIPGVDQPLEKALHLANRAIQLAPQSSRGFLALSFAQYFKGDVDGSLATLRTGLVLNPNDTEILSELGLRLAVRGNWDEAVPILQESYDRNPAQPGAYRVGLSLWHVAFGRFQEGLVEAQKVNSPKVIYGHLMVAVCASRLGLHDIAQAAVAEILAINPDYGSQIRADLELRFVTADMIRIIVDALAAAGLPGGEEKSSLESPALGNLNEFLQSAAS